jgi:hypothetical protein
MAGLVPAIHAFCCSSFVKTWMPGTSPGMTVREASPFSQAYPPRRPTYASPSVSNIAALMASAGVLPAQTTNWNAG